MREDADDTTVAAVVSGLRRGLAWAVTIIMIVMLIPTVLRFGPIVESWLNPVLDPLESVEVITRKVLSNEPSPVRLLFRAHYIKHRACVLNEASWRWFLDHSAFPAVLRYADTGEQFRAETTGTTGEFLSRERYVDLPQEAFSYKEVWLVGSYFYPAFCQGLFPTAYEIRIKVVIPSSDATPLPKAVPEAEVVVPTVLKP